MTNKELQEELKQFPDDAVVVAVDYEMGMGEVTGVFKTRYIPLSIKKKMTENQEAIEILFD